MSATSPVRLECALVSFCESEYKWQRLIGYVMEERSLLAGESRVLKLI